MQNYFQAGGISGDATLAGVQAVLRSLIMKQAYMKGIDDIMIVMAILALLGLPLLFLLTKKRVEMEKQRQG